MIKKLYHYQLCFSFQRNEYMHFQLLVIYFCLYYYSSNHDKIGKYFKSKIHISTYYSCAFSPNIGFFIQCCCRQNYPCLCMSRDKHFSFSFVFFAAFSSQRSEQFARGDQVLDLLLSAGMINWKNRMRIRCLPY